uniref:Chromosomal replication initiator protein DnaA ATPAse domain-containing protein n=1 Tax=Streptomyces sp. F11 TaxID=319318 RepID=Q58IP4_9ACTN|nr:DnaA/Hda family protein [Streptomyces sp. F11]AAX51339.1 unknown [Streptomyces sp. F11]
MWFAGDILAIADFSKRVKTEVPCKRYVHSMKYTDESITSVHDGKGDRFGKRYREMVILFLSDPQFVTRQNRAHA